jgi:hypothetical protein
MGPINSGHSGAVINNPEGTMRKERQAPTVDQVRVRVDRVPLFIRNQIRLFVLRCRYSH